MERDPKYDCLIVLFLPAGDVRTRSIPPIRATNAKRGLIKHRRRKAERDTRTTSSEDCSSEERYRLTERRNDDHSIFRFSPKPKEQKLLLSPAQLF
jgi:hypothetical protein